MSKVGAVFFDRDGVLIKDTNWIVNMRQISILPDAFEAIKAVNKAGLRVVIVSNQSAVARGHISRTQLFAMDKYIRALFLAKGAKIDKSYYCVHHPDFSGNCICRKPKTGLFKKAQRELLINMSKSYVIGDMLSDMEAGKKAGCCMGILVKRNQKKWTTSDFENWVDMKADNVRGAVNLILKSLA